MGAPLYRRLVLHVVLALLGEGEQDDYQGGSIPGTFHSALAAASFPPESALQSAEKDTRGADRRWS